MGKGDRKTAKGKRSIASYGNARTHTAAKATGSQSLVEDKVSGRLITPGAIHQFADALQAYCVNTDLRAEHGNIGERRSLDYSWDAINQTVADTYLRLIRQRAARDIAAR